jgi:hypothetical protein
MMLIPSKEISEFNFQQMTAELLSSVKILVVEPTLKLKSRILTILIQDFILFVLICLRVSQTMFSFQEERVDKAKTGVYLLSFLQKLKYHKTSKTFRKRKLSKSSETMIITNGQSS